MHRHRFLDRVARGAFSRLAAADGEIAIIQSGPLKGLKLAVSEHTSHAHLSGTYEPEVLRAIDACLRRGWICYDLGASIGILTLLMARKAGKVYAFEPAPHAAAEMRRQVAANGFVNVTIVPFPVSDRERDVSFALTDAAYGSAIRETPSQWPTLNLRATTLDAFASGHDFPDFIKIDVEGEEGRVLEGARTVLACRRTVICCELHSDEAAAKVLAILREYGYRVSRLTGEPFELRSGDAIPGELQVMAVPQRPE